MLSSYREIRVIEVRIIELKLRIKYSFRYCQQICLSYRNIRITEGSSYGSSTVTISLKHSLFCKKYTE
jgi:hypothetical protein